MTGAGLASRRAVLVGIGAGAAWPVLAASPAPYGGPGLRTAIAGLEREAKARIGLVVRDRGTGAMFAWRGDERFPLCSTFKYLLAAAVLVRVDAGYERLDRAVPVAAADIIANSPVTRRHVGGTASVAELCEAAITLSDNAAANLLLPSVGGPAGLTRFFRALGDGRTRLDRTEPTLNEARPGDPRDTTTPRTMLGLLDRVAFGAVLLPVSRARLIGWMRATKTGDRRLRAGLPAGWAIADKTGAGAHGSDNEVAILWPPKRQPLLVASYITGNGLTLERTNALHARIGGLLT